MARNLLYLGMCKRSLRSLLVYLQGEKILNPLCVLNTKLVRDEYEGPDSASLRGKFLSYHGSAVSKAFGKMSAPFLYHLKI